MKKLTFEEVMDKYEEWKSEAKIWRKYYQSPHLRYLLENKHII